MNIQEAFDAIISAGFLLEGDGTDILVSPAERLTDRQRAFIRRHKPELMRLLVAKQSTLNQPLERVAYEPGDFVSKPIPRCSNRRWNFQQGCWADPLPNDNQKTGK